MTIITHIAAFISGGIASLVAVYWWLIRDPHPEDRTMAEEDDPYSNE